MTVSNDSLNGLIFLSSQGPVVATVIGLSIIIFLVVIAFGYFCTSKKPLKKIVKSKMP